MQQSVVIKCEPRCASSRLESAYRANGYTHIFIKPNKFNFLVKPPCIVKDHTITWLPKEIKNIKFIHLQRKDVFAQALSKIVVHTLKGNVKFDPYHPLVTDVIDIKPWEVSVDRVKKEIDVVERNVALTTEVLKNIPHQVVYTEDIIKNDDAIIEITGFKPDYTKQHYIMRSRLTPEVVIKNYNELREYFN